MSSEVLSSTSAAAGRAAAAAPPPRRKRTAGSALVAHGEPLIWLTGGSLAVCLSMIFLLLVWILVCGLSTFWPVPIVELRLSNGRVYMGEVWRREAYRPGEAAMADLSSEAAARVAAQTGSSERQLLRVGNFELSGNHFLWISDFELAADGETTPPWAVIVERLAWGRFYGFPKAFTIDGKTVSDDPAKVWALFQQHHGDARRRWAEAGSLRENGIGALNSRLEAARLAKRDVELRRARSRDPSKWDGALAAAAARLVEVEKQTSAEAESISERINEIEGENDRYRLVMATAESQEKPLALEEIVRAYPANQVSFGQKLAIYASRWWEFLSDEPREANSEGGVYPAIFGTVAMTLIMSLAVVPFGVLAALYMREYAKGGLIVSVVRIAINNLAGVPSIVFGVFGLGFFCYLVGGFIDGGPSRPWSESNWTSGLVALAALTSVAVAVAVLNWMGASGRLGDANRRGWAKVWLPRASAALWLACAVTTVWLIAKTPHFNGFYEAALPTPTFGKGALVWASLTLALLTLPVVIVATEEALSAVPNSMREGSYACGASKWQTVRRIVLPRAMPGIMTGMILAMARGAGEVAPLMLVGAVKLTANLPIDGVWPYAHPERSFMHLGFHIYDVAFQSPNSEAAKPMVYTTTLLLITIIASLNLAAVWVRARLRRRFLSHQF